MDSMSKQPIYSSILCEKYEDYLKIFVIHAIAAVLMLVVVLRATNR
jgi:hypothetical protein